MTEPAKGQPRAADVRRHRSQRKHLDELLDQALADTFPASDPVSVVQPAPDPAVDDDGQPEN